MRMIEFVFGSEQSDCSRATAHQEMIPHGLLIPDTALMNGAIGIRTTAGASGSVII
jgi:hypothetical protein